MNLDYSKVKTSDFAPKHDDVVTILTIQNPVGVEKKMYIQRNGIVAELNVTLEVFLAKIQKAGFKIINEKQI